MAHDENKEQFDLTCKYCGHVQKWDLAQSQRFNPDLRDIDDVLEYDQSIECKRCGCEVRVNEGLDEEVLDRFGFI